MSVYENFDEQKQFACRVIADHARATAFAIADGILPGNEGRNYVLRKIMRRAIYHGREHLGFDGLFFNKVCDFVVEQMKDAYPELEIQRDFIGKMVRLEEERFGATMTVGLKKLSEFINNGNVEIKDLAYIYDTYGTPFDLIFVTLAQNDIEVTDNYAPAIPLKHGVLIPSFKVSFGIPHRIDIVTGEIISATDYIDEEEFKDKFDKAIQRRQNSSEIGKTRQAEKINPIYADLQNTNVKSNFHGYDKTEVEGAKVLALVKNDQKVDVLSEGDEGLIVLDETPFYAESGGQVGDAGMIVRTAYGSGRLNADNVNVGGNADASNSDVKPSATADGSDKTANSLVKVIDTFAPIAGIVLHKSKIEKGSIKVGDVVTATVDVFKRDATRRNHTATHLVHAALKEVLGTHVKQAGSVVAPNYLRFDFTHYQPISEAELTEIEDLVNREILKNDPVNTDLMSIEDAMRSGAMALFGEKYGSTVRVLSVGGGEFSKELCGGTHVRATGDIGSFKIMSDEAVASGVRRIRAITGIDAFERFREDEKLIAEAVQIAKAQRDNLPSAIEKLQEELKKARRENDELKMKIATGAIGGASSNGDEAKDINGVKVIAKTVDGLDKGGMRHLSDTLMAQIKSGVVIIAKAEDGKVSFIVRVSDDLTGKISAGKIVQQIAPIVSGRGGGKPDMAEGGGTDAGKLNDALEASYGVIEGMLA